MTLFTFAALATLLDKALEALFGGYSDPSKMPCLSWSIPADNCGVGSRLRRVVGSVCAICYALKGCYVFKSTRDAMARRLAILRDAMADEDAREAFVAAFSYSLERRAARTRKRLANGKRLPRNDGRYFRFHDSGDFQGLAHLLIVLDIIRRAPSVAFWIPTREYKTLLAYLESGGAIPSNCVIRVSLPMVGAAPVPMLLARLATHEGVELSGAHENAGAPPDGRFECGAYRRSGACGPCRACWRREIPLVTYPTH